jgi:hypothetical protein
MARRSQRRVRSVPAAASTHPDPGECGEFQLKSTGSVQRSDELRHCQRGDAVGSGIGAACGYGERGFKPVELRCGGTELLLERGGAAVKSFQCTSVAREIVRHRHMDVDAAKQCALPERRNQRDNDRDDGERAGRTGWRGFVLSYGLASCCGFGG